MALQLTYKIKECMTGNISSIRERFSSIGRLTPEHRIIAEVLDGYLSELVSRLERVERVIDFRPQDIKRVKE